MKTIEQELEYYIKEFPIGWSLFDKFDKDNLPVME